MRVFQFLTVLMIFCTLHRVDGKSMEFCGIMMLV